MRMDEAIEHNAAVKRGRNTKPILGRLEMEKTVVDGKDGHKVTRHFNNESGAYHQPESQSFSKHDGPLPQLPKGHVLQHIAEHMDIPHEVAGGKNEEPEEEEEEGEE